MKPYVVSKDFKVVAQKPSLSKADKKDGCKLVMTWDKLVKGDKESGEYAVGEEIAKANCLTTAQAVEILQSTRAHLMQFIIGNTK